MGMNYYLVSPACECCGRADPPLHIGKSSHGWAFSFRAHPDRGIRSAKDWDRYFSLFFQRPDKGYIADEGGERLEFREFWDMVAHKRNGLVHALEHPSERDWVDEEGHSFSDAEFS